MVITIKGDTAEEYAQSALDAKIAVQGYTVLTEDIAKDDWWYETPEGSLVQVVWTERTHPELTPGEAVALAMKYMT